MRLISYKIFTLIALLMVLGSSAQEINKVMVDPDIELEILIGVMDISGLQNPLFVENWPIAMDEYTPDQEAVKKLKKYFRKHKDVRMEVFFGSWCGDSKEQLPLFVKLAHKAKIKRVEYMALNRKKTLPEKDISKFGIEFVPTFIVFKDDVELGRIIETPVVSLEKDLVKILNL